MARPGSTLLLLADGRLPAGGHAHSGGLEEAVAAGRVTNAGQLAAWLSGRLSTTGRVDAALAAITAHWVAAAQAGAAAGTPSGGLRIIRRLDAEAAARCPSPAQRRALRAQGRGLIRAGRRMWPGPLLDELFTGGSPGKTPVAGTSASTISVDADPVTTGPALGTATGPALGTAAGPGTVAVTGLMWPVALGAVGVAAGCSPGEVALVAAHSSVSGPAWAATRLLGLDPFAVARCLADLAEPIDAVAANATANPAVANPAAAIGLPSFDLEAADPATADAHGAPLSEIGAEIHAIWEVRLFAS